MCYNSGKVLFRRKVKSSEELVKEIRSYLGIRLWIHLSALVFVSGADRGEELFGDACEAG